MPKKCGIDIVEPDIDDTDSEIDRMFESLSDSKNKSYDSDGK